MAILQCHVVVILRVKILVEQIDIINHFGAFGTMISNETLNSFFYLESELWVKCRKREIVFYKKMSANLDVSCWLYL